MHYVQTGLSPSGADCSRLTLATGDSSEHSKTGEAVKPCSRRSQDCQSDQSCHRASAAQCGLHIAAPSFKRYVTSRSTFCAMDACNKDLLVSGADLENATSNFLKGRCKSRSMKVVMACSTCILTMASCLVCPLSNLETDGQGPCTPFASLGRVENIHFEEF